MLCPKCAKENSEKRKFCSECGSMLMIYCQQCGFHNSITDNYCGGCGRNLEAMSITTGTDSLPTHHNRPVHRAKEDIKSDKYSADDIEELIHGQSKKADLSDKKKELKKEVEVSQDFLDDIFSKENS